MMRATCMYLYLDIYYSWNGQRAIPQQLQSSKHKDVPANLYNYDYNNINIILLFIYFIYCRVQGI